MLEIKVNGSKGMVVTDDNKTLIYDKRIANEIDAASDKSDKPNYTLVKDGNEKEEK